MPCRFCALARLSAVAALALSPPSARAAVLFDFEGQAIGTQTPFTVMTGGLDALFAGPPGVDPDAFEISYNSSSGPLGAPYRTLRGAFLTIGNALRAPGSALTITFKAPLSGLTLDFALNDPGNAASLTLATDAGGSASARGTLSAGFRYPEGLLSFGGAPFRTVTLSSSALDFQLDNVAATLAPAATVPEPASLTTLGAGLAAAAAARRRRRNPARS